MNKFMHVGFIKGYLEKTAFKMSDIAPYMSGAIVGPPLMATLGGLMANPGQKLRGIGYGALMGLGMGAGADIGSGLSRPYSLLTDTPTDFLLHTPTMFGGGLLGAYLGHQIMRKQIGEEQLKEIFGE